MRHTIHHYTIPTLCLLTLALLALPADVRAQALDFECLPPGQIFPGDCETPGMLISGLLIRVFAPEGELIIDDSTGSNMLTYDTCSSSFPGYLIRLPTDVTATMISFDVDSVILTDITVRAYDETLTELDETTFPDASPGHIDYTSPVAFHAARIIVGEIGVQLFRGAIDNIEIPGLDLTCTPAQIPPLFADGFESGDILVWSGTVP